MASPKFTEGQLEAALRKNAGIKSQAAKELGVERQTIQDRVDCSPKLQKIIRDIRERVVDLAEGVVVDALNKKDKQTARWALERLGKSRGYGNSVQNSFDETQLEAIVASIGGDPEKLRSALVSLGAPPEET